MYAQLIERTKAAIVRLTADRSVSAVVALAALKGVREHLDLLIEMSELDIEDEGRALDETFRGLQP